MHVVKVQMMGGADWSLLVCLEATVYGNGMVRIVDCVFSSCHLPCAAVNCTDSSYAVRYIINLPLPKWEGIIARYFTLV